MDRVQWFREQAARDRLREEKEILEEEIRRVVTSFDTMADTWNQLALRKGPKQAGAMAYAFKQSHMYSKMAEKGKEVRRRMRAAADAHDAWRMKYLGTVDTITSV